MKRTVKVQPGFGRLELILAATTLICLAATATYAGIDSIVRTTEVQDLNSWKRCLQGKRLVATTEHCKRIEQRVIEAANAAEAGL